MATATATATAKKMFIDGKWCDADDGKTHRRHQPGHRGSHRRDRLRQPGRRRAAPSRPPAGRCPRWMKLTACDRAKVLKKTADLMRERADAIARTLTMEQGKPLAEAKAEVLHSADTFEWFAEEGKRAYGQVIPQLGARQAARHAQAPGRRRRRDQPVELPDHAAGAQDRPGPGRRLHHRLQAGQPDAAVPDAGLRVPGRGRAARRASPTSSSGRPRRSPTSSSKTRSCRKISFTGSTEVGKQLMRGAADQVKRLSLELGGHAPFIVFPDADPEVGRQDRRHRQVPQQRPGVHRAEPVLRPQGRAEEVHRGGRRVRQAARSSATAWTPASRSARCSRRRRWTAPSDLVDDAKQARRKVLTGGKRSDRFAKGYFFEPTVLTRRAGRREDA